MTEHAATGEEQAPAPAGPSDGDLAQRVARGDRQAAAELIDRHQAAVRQFLRRLTGRDDVADDLAQETLLRLLCHAQRYDPAYPMRTWLLTIARRLSINRARRADERVGRMEAGDLPSATPGPAEAAAEHDQSEVARARLATALAQISERQRCAIALFHQQGLAIEEVARAMGLPKGTVKSHLHRGRAALRQILAPQREVLQP